MDFTKKITTEDVLKAIEHVEHPEIELTMMELGMILVVFVEKKYNGESHFSFTHAGYTRSCSKHHYRKHPETH
jgi:metal-sulfur cluster biosynthetic enzyme